MLLIFINTIFLFLESIYRFPTLPSIRAFNYFKKRINSLLQIEEYLPKIKKPPISFVN